LHQSHHHRKDGDDGQPWMEGILRFPRPMRSLWQQISMLSLSSLPLSWYFRLFHRPLSLLSSVPSWGPPNQ
jgi:hypothetical protein